MCPIFVRHHDLTLQAEIISWGILHGVYYCCSDKREIWNAEGPPRLLGVGILLKAPQNILLLLPLCALCRAGRVCVCRCVCLWDRRVKRLLQLCSDGIEGPSMACGSCWIVGWRDHCLILSFLRGNAVFYAQKGKQRPEQTFDFQFLLVAFSTLVQHPVLSYDKHQQSFHWERKLGWEN